MKFIKDNWIIPLLVIKNLFSGLVQVVWGLVSMGALAWTMFFLKDKYPTAHIPEINSGIKLIIDLIIDHYILLSIVFMIVYFYFDYKELRKVQDAKKEAKE